MSNPTMSLFIAPAPFPRTRSDPSSTRCIKRPTRATAETPAPPSKAAFSIPKFAQFLYDTQASLCAKLEAIDTRANFCSDPWQLENGNAGITRVLQQGRIFEKAGVNVSVVGGVLSEARASAMRSTGRRCEAGMEYRAAALSFVFHAQSPFVPTLRGDVRVFVTKDQYWGGGGVDLTVFYVNESQISRFHKQLKRMCDDFEPAFYPQFKKQCDEYFYLPSRAEHRGVGGLFYDGVALPEPRLLDFQARLLSESFRSYLPILEENIEIPWTEEQKRWQRIRRGRYLEFNLLNDRGVRFGLAGGRPSRTDAIMISAPPSIDWPYNYVPASGSPEEKTSILLRGKPVEWAEL